MLGHSYLGRIYQKIYYLTCVVIFLDVAVQQSILQLIQFLIINILFYTKITTLEEKGGNESSKYHKENKDLCLRFIKVYLLMQLILIYICNITAFKEVILENEIKDEKDQKSNMSTHMRILKILGLINRSDYHIMLCCLVISACLCLD